MSDSPDRSRRNFLGRILAGWGGFTALPFVYAIVRYVYPPASREQMISSLNAAKVTDVPPNTAKIVRFNKRPVIVVHTTEGQFKAFAANCTHLGCVVEYREEDGNFHCNCHGSIFDLNGSNVKGPASTPLKPVKVTLKETDIVLSIPLG